MGNNRIVDRCEICNVGVTKNSSRCLKHRRDRKKQVTLYSSEPDIDLRLDQANYSKAEKNKYRKALLFKDEKMMNSIRCRCRENYICPVHHIEKLKEDLND